MVLSVQRPRYKYVSCLDHAKWFQQGKMFHRTAAYYRDYEDKKAAQVIGDQYECTRLYSPAGFRTIALDGTPGEWQRLPPGQRREGSTGALRSTAVGGRNLKPAPALRYSTQQNFTLDG